MEKNKTTQTNSAEIAKRKKKLPKSGVRDAVETAIDLAKSDPQLTWEQQLSRDPERIAKWGEVFSE